MRVMWVAGNGGKYKSNVIKGTGGWIGSLQEELLKAVPNLELGITFPSTDSTVVQEGRVSYFPIPVKSETGKYNQIKTLLLNKSKKTDEIIKEGMLKAINDYKPGVVHIWGLENPYAVIIPHLDVPFIVHIQGFMTPIYNSYFSPGFSLLNLKQMDSLKNPKNWIYRWLHLSQMHEYEDYKRRSEIERAVAPYIKYWMGRTEWDKDIAKLLSPQSEYYYCGEVVRNEFKGKAWEYHYDGILRIHSSISQYWYKGIDTILKTADTLKSLGVNFEWNVYGVKPGHRLATYFEKCLGIKAAETGVRYRGYVDGTTIRESLLNCDVFVHPSNIENSSNAIAEAMMLGVPTVAQYVGGNPTMLKDDSGILVSQGEPMIMAAAILKMREKEVAKKYSEKARQISEKRQNNENTIKDLLRVYDVVLAKTRC